MKLGQEEDKRGGRVLFGEGEGGGWRVGQRASEQGVQTGGGWAGKVRGEANRRGG